jgi:hypothetical protein
MPTIQLRAQLSADDLLEAIGQLEAAELNQFVQRVLALRAQRQAPCLGPEESELLRQINQGLPEQLRQRYEELIGKRRQEALSAEEHSELLQLTDQVEITEANRAKALAELARLRKKPLAELLNDLGIPSPADG